MPGSSNSQMKRVGFFLGTERRNTLRRNPGKNFPFQKHTYIKKSQVSAWLQ
jgi:hypothetical protein